MPQLTATTSTRAARLLTLLRSMKSFVASSVGSWPRPSRTLSSVRLVGQDTLVPTLFVNTSSLAFPLSMFTDAMNLLQLIPFSRTHQPLTMVLHAPKNWSPMPMGLSLTGDALSYAHKQGFPSETAERKGRFVGFGESVGDALEFKVLTNDTQKILYRSTICSALSEAQQKELLGWSDRNQRAEPSGTPSFPPNLDSPTAPKIVCIPSRDKSDNTKQHMSVVAPNDLITRTYLTEPDANTGGAFLCQDCQEDRVTGKRT